MEERTKALKQLEEQLYNNIATVLQEKDLMIREKMEERSKALKKRKEQFYDNLATVLQKKRPNET